MALSRLELRLFLFKDHVRELHLRHTMPFPDPPLPLTFKQVMENRPVAAESSTFIHFPDELKASILQYLVKDEEALAKLATFNSDCRQLARSCQFNCLSLRFDLRSYTIVYVLGKEIIERLTTCERRPRRPSFGACIRHLRVDCRLYLPTEHGESRDDSFIRNMLEALDEEREPGQDDMFKKPPKHWLPDMLGAIPSLPHLKSLSLLNGPLCDNLVDALMRSPATHLRLDGIFGKNLSLRPNRDDWPLESLGINFRVPWQGSEEKLDVSPFWGELLWLCCSTLRFLKLEQHLSARTAQQKYQPLWFKQRFPKLRTVLLYGGIILSTPALASLLQSDDLSTLRLQFSGQEESARNLLGRPTKRHKLETLVIEWLRPPERRDIGFIKANTGIKSLVLTSPNRLGLGPFNLFAIRSLTEHTELKLLSLKWGQHGIVLNDILSALRPPLTSLEVLHLNVVTFDQPWVLDHEDIAPRLAPLTGLRRLIFEGDCCITNRGIKFPLGVASPHHQNEMLKQAQFYVKPFPQLELLHIGELLITFKKGTDDHRTPVVTGTTRDEAGSGYGLEKRELGIEGPVSAMDYARETLEWNRRLLNGEVW